MTRILFMFVFFSACGPKDLRPGHLRRNGADTSQQAEGRRLIEASVDATGGWQAYRDVAAFELSAIDTWDHWLGERAFLRYDKAQTFDLWAANPGVNDLRMTLTNGDFAGDEWGYRDGEGYEVSDGNLDEDPDAIQVLFVKTTVALIGLPMRLASASDVAYLGDVEIDEQRYHSVFLTWGGFEPNKTFDHWVVYLHPDTLRIDYCEFTIREYESVVSMPVARKGAFALADYREVDGLWVPHRTEALLRLGGKPVHVYELSNVRVHHHQDDG